MKKIILISFLFVSCINNINLNNSYKYNVYMSVLKNKTTKARINEMLTQEFNKMLINSNYNVVNINNADYIIKGEVKNFSKSADVYNENDVIQMYTITISTIITVYKKNKTNPIFSFNLDGSTLYSETSFNPETEEQAIDRLKSIISLNFIKLLNKNLKKYGKEKTN